MAKRQCGAEVRTEIKHASNFGIKGLEEERGCQFSRKAEREENRMGNDCKDGCENDALYATEVHLESKYDKGNGPGQEAGEYQNHSAVYQAQDKQLGRNKTPFQLSPGEKPGTDGGDQGDGCRHRRPGQGPSPATIIRSLRDSSQNQAGVAKADLAAAEKTVEKNLGKLDQEMKRMQAKVHVLQEELNILRTYMDKEYPVKAVQIASLMRSVRNLNEEQQDELEEMEDVFKKCLDNMATKAQKERERFLQRVTEKKLMEYQDGLHQMDKNNLELKRQISKQKEVIAGLVKDVTALHKNLNTLHHSAGDPREVIFADVLLRRPKCTPDMDIVLNIPTDEDFPL
ncbi:uncharacterized protein C20orf96 homolog isoform X2 [Podarcis muralis]